MNQDIDYKRILTEVIAKQAAILGPQIAVMRARGVKGLTITDDGKVAQIEGDAQEVLQRLIDQYVDLSGEIVRATLGSIFQKYPSVDEG
jgi:hypothetical protein